MVRDDARFTNQSGNEGVVCFPVVSYEQSERKRAQALPFQQLDGQIMNPLIFERFQAIYGRFRQQRIFRLGVLHKRGDIQRKRPAPSRLQTEGLQKQSPYRLVLFMQSRMRQIPHFGIGCFFGKPVYGAGHF